MAQRGCRVLGWCQLPCSSTRVSAGVCAQNFVRGPVCRCLAHEVLCYYFTALWPQVRSTALHDGNLQQRVSSGTLCSNKRPLDNSSNAPTYLWKQQFSFSNMSVIGTSGGTWWSKVQLRSMLRRSRDSTTVGEPLCNMPMKNMVGTCKLSRRASAVANFTQTRY